MSFIVQIEGLRFAGKSSLVMKLASYLFQNGYSVSIIPEWRFQDNGPTDTDQWIEEVFNERVHSAMIAKSNSSDIVICDRSFIGLQAFVECTYPIKKDEIKRKINEKIYDVDLYIFLYASQETIRKRAIMRQCSIGQINSSKIINSYIGIYEQRKINPLIIDTSDITEEQLSKEVASNIIKKLKNK